MVRKECRFCQKFLPKHRSKRIGGQWVEQYFRLHPTFCNCQGNVFIHRECIKKEAVESPDKCPHCKSPWNNLVILRETVKSFGDLKRKWGFWATDLSLALSLILTTLVAPGLSHVVGRKQSKSWISSIYFDVGIITWFVIYWIVRILAYRMARVLNVQVAHHADFRQGNMFDNICRFCFKSINVLQNQNIKVYPRKYFCNCNGFECESCLKTLASRLDDCHFCGDTFRNVRFQEDQPLTYLEYRSMQNAYPVYRRFLIFFVSVFFLPMIAILVIYTLLIPYLKGEPIRPRDRHSFRFELVKFLVDNWPTIVFPSVSVTIHLTVFFIEVMIYPRQYSYLLNNNRIHRRRVVTIREPNQ